MCGQQCSPGLQLSSVQCAVVVENQAIEMDLGSHLGHLSVIVSDLFLK